MDQKLQEKQAMPITNFRASFAVPNTPNSKNLSEDQRRQSILLPKKPGKMEEMLNKIGGHKGHSLKVRVLYF